MSTSYGNTIPIFASGKKLKKIVGGIVTDSTPLGEPLDPDSCTVFALLQLFASGDELERIAGYYRAGKRDGEPFGYGHAKQMLAERIESTFAKARARRDQLAAEPEIVERVLVASAAKARVIARETIQRCKRAVGLA
jgi:tryptophanyl-tRNA synthetase